jgi:hypothetical protein
VYLTRPIEHQNASSNAFRLPRRSIHDELIV